MHTYYDKPLIFQGLLVSTSNFGISSSYANYSMVLSNSDVQAQRLYFLHHFRLLHKLTNFDLVAFSR